MRLRSFNYKKRASQRTTSNCCKINKLLNDESLKSNSNLYFNGDSLHTSRKKKSIERLQNADRSNSLVFAAKQMQLARLETSLYRLGVKLSSIFTTIGHIQHACLLRQGPRPVENGIQRRHFGTQIGQPAEDKQKADFQADLRENVREIKTRKAARDLRTKLDKMRVEKPKPEAKDGARTGLSADQCDPRTKLDRTRAPDAAPETADPKHARFRQPKSVLHSFYTIVAHELKNNDLKLNPVYSSVKERKGTISWCCTYSVKWPEAAKFSAHDGNKKNASRLAALHALNWLRERGKMTKEGAPIIVDGAEAAELTRKTIQRLSLGADTVRLMEGAVAMYEEEMAPKIDGFMDRVGGEPTKEADEGELKFDQATRQKKLLFYKHERYLAKEAVKLPITEYKEKFIELLNAHRVVIVKGEPGCGKSTRIPQYVLESWIRDANARSTFCRIAVTQPRRIAAISLADRVAAEREEAPGEIVGYQVRLKQNFSPKSGRILYCTTGILLRHLQSDPALVNFSHIILDEAHERDVNTDLLMNLLKNTLELNPNAKLVVMSATIDAEKFSNYFDGAPALHVPGFTYPVTSHFLDDFEDRIGWDFAKTRKMCEEESPTVTTENVVDLIRYLHLKRPEGAILCFLPGWDDISKISKLLPNDRDDLMVLCLHSRLRDSEQRRIFSRPRKGVRKVILATNIAETSVTIDDVVYVIDTGVHKESVFDHDKGVTCIDNYWISQASMKQRKGRAGRCQAGESFHLYTNARFDRMKEFTDPEILRTSLTKIVLDSKVFSNNMNATEFMGQLLSPPEKSAIRLAVNELKELKLLDVNENLTHLGRALAKFQLEPKLAKVLINSVVFKCVTPVVDIVTLFSDGAEIFAKTLMQRDKEEVNRVKQAAHPSSDHLAVMRLFEKWLELLEEGSEEEATRYCNHVSLVPHKMKTIEKLRQIHFDYLHNLHKALPVADDFSDNDELVKAILFSGVGTVLKHRNFDIVKGRVKQSNVFLTEHNHRAQVTSESVNFKKVKFPSDLLVYCNEVRSNIRRTSLVRECSVISPLAVLLFSNKNLSFQEDGDNVVLGLENTKISYICTPSEAETIRRCKEVLDTGYEYFIYQITEGGVSRQDLNFIWGQLLQNINQVLLKNNV